LLYPAVDAGGATAKMRRRRGYPPRKMHFHPRRVLQPFSPQVK